MLRRFEEKERQLQGSAANDARMLVAGMAPPTPGSPSRRRLTVASVGDLLSPRAAAMGGPGVATSPSRRGTVASPSALAAMSSPLTPRRLSRMSMSQSPQLKALPRRGTALGIGGL